MKTFIAAIVCLSLAGSAWAAGPVVVVKDRDGLQTAVGKAKPGTIIQIAPGNYPGSVCAANLAGDQGAPIVIEAADPARPPVFEGGSNGLFLSNCRYLTLRNLVVHGAKDNGINIDDGGTLAGTSHHIVLENVEVRDVGPAGNHDGIKISGVDDFSIRNCTVEGWGGQAVDMVGCHRGLIESCTFRGKDGFEQATGPQTKGGTSDVTIRACFFDHAGQRAVNVGGSTGMAFFRPKGAKYEAKDITVEGCTFNECEAPAAFVGVDGAVFRHNTIYRPRIWVFRILQETKEEGFAPCRNVTIERNLIVFRMADLRSVINIGPSTSPETFTFRNNLWFCEDKPAASKPQLPSAESGGIYSQNPQLKNPAKLDFTPQAKDAATFGAEALPKATSAPATRRETDTQH